LDETNNALQRIRELAVQSNNGTVNDANDREAIQSEVDQLLAEIDRIATSTKFNSVSMLQNGASNLVFQVGADHADTLKVTFDGAETGDIGVNSLKVNTAVLASTAITTVTAAINSVSDTRSTLGAYQNRFESLIANLSNVSENTSSARSRIMDADIAQESANLTRNSIMQQAGSAILAQANQQPQIALQLLR
jgi:flagellin